METFVVDASVALAWCFEDERTAYTESVLDRAAAGAPMVVPRHWHFEIANGLLTALRRKRVGEVRARQLLTELHRFDIDTDTASAHTASGLTFELAIRHALTVYDAAYLELAQRRGCALATLDAQLRRAAVTAGVRLLEG